MKKTKSFPSKVILWGGTGQAKVVRAILEQWGSEVVAIFDDTPNLPPPFPDVDLYKGWKGFERWIKGRKPQQFGFCVTIGNPHGRARLRFHEQLQAKGLHPVNAIHPSAQMAKNAVLGAGIQVMAGAIVAPDAKIGQQCIINTKASVDHECVLGDGVEIGPGATLCGSVNVKTNAWVCAGATVLPRVTIGADAIVGAGAVVLRDVLPQTTVVGVPASRLLPRQSA